MKENIHQKEHAFLSFKNLVKNPKTLNRQMHMLFRKVALLAI